MTDDIETSDERAEHADDVVPEPVERVNLSSPHGRPIPVLVGGAVSLLLVLGAGSATASVLSFLDGRTSTENSSAAGNLSRCQSTLNANWRRGIAVLVIGTGTDAEIAEAAALLDLPADPQEMRAIGRRYVVAALADDARLTVATDRICPFFPGDPGRTPDQPVRSAFAALLDTERPRPPTGTTTTTTSTTTTTEPGD